MTTTNPFDERAKPLQHLYDTLEAVCLRHPSISMFDSGDEDDFGGDHYTYPLAYLETINYFSESDSKTLETYTVALNLVDRQPEAQDRKATILTHDRLKQVFSEIKGYLELKHVFGERNVGPADVLVTNGKGDDVLVSFRAEFTITVKTLLPTAQDLKTLFES